MSRPARSDAGPTEASVRRGRPIALILLSGALGVGGQLLLKRGVADLGPLVLTPDALVPLFHRLILTPAIPLGLLVYLCGTAFWLRVLAEADLSFAYPVASLNYLFVLSSSWLLLGEQPTASRLTGVVLICLGVYVISRSPVRTGRPLSLSPRPTAALVETPR